MAQPVQTGGHAGSGRPPIPSNHEKERLADALTREGDGNAFARSGSSRSQATPAKGASGLWQASFR